MKERNMSLVRKILLAVLAALLCAGAFFGVLAMNRSDAAGIFAQATETVDPLVQERATAKEAVTTAYTKWSQGLEAGSRSLAFLDAEKTALETKIDESVRVSEPMEVVRDVDARFVLAIQKGYAQDRLEKAFVAIRGTDLPVDAKKDVDLSGVANADGTDAAEGKEAEYDLYNYVKTAFKTIADASNIEGVNAELKTATKDLLVGTVGVLQEGDSANIYNYLHLINNGVDALEADPEKGLEDVESGLLDVLSVVAPKEAADVATELKTKKDDETAKAVDDYTKVYAAVTGSTAIPETDKTVENLQKATDCKTLNETLKAAVDALLKALEDAHATNGSETLKDLISAAQTAVGTEYAAKEEGKTNADRVLATYLGCVTKEAGDDDTTVTVTLKAKIDAQLLVDAKAKAKTEFGEVLTALGLSENADATKIQTAAETAIDAVTLTTIEAALESVNEALKDNVKKLIPLLKLKDEKGAVLDSQAVQNYLDTTVILSITNADTTGANAYWGLSDLSETLKDVVTKLDELRNADLTAVKNALLGAYNAIMGLTEGAEDYITSENYETAAPAYLKIAYAKITEKNLNEALDQLLVALVGTEDPKAEGMLDAWNYINANDSTVVLGYLPAAKTAVKNAIEEAKTNGVAPDFSKVENVNGLKKTIDKQRAEEKTATLEAYKAAYSYLMGEEYAEETLAALEGKVYCKDLTDALKAAIEALLDEVAKVDGVSVENVEAITNPVKTNEALLLVYTTANGGAEGKTVAPADKAKLETALKATKVKELTDFRKYQNAALDELKALKTDILANVLADEVSALTTKLDEAINRASNTENGTIEKAVLGDKELATAEGEIDKAKGHVIAEMNNASRVLIAVKEYNDSYQELVGSDGLTEALNTFKTETLKDKTTATDINNALKEAVQALIDRLVKTAPEAEKDPQNVVTLAEELKKLVGDAELGKGAHSEIADVSAVANGAKEKLDYRRALNAAIAELEAKYTAIEDGAQLGKRMSADDLAALKAQKDGMVKVIDGLSLGLGEKTTWAEALKAAKDELDKLKTADLSALDVTALQYVAKQEYVDSYKNALNPETVDTTAFMKSLEEKKTASDINTTLIDTLDDELTEALSGHSAKAKAIIDPCLEALRKLKEGDLATNIVDASATLMVEEQTLQKAIEGVVVSEREEAEADYKAYYKAIKEFAEDPAVDDTIKSLRSAADNKTLNNTLLAAVKALYEEKVKGQPESVKAIVTAAFKADGGDKGDFQTLVDTANTSGVLVDFTAKITAMNLLVQKGVAKQDYLDSYKAIIGTDATVTEAPASTALEAIDDAADLAGVNTALKEQVCNLLDTLLTPNKESKAVREAVEAVKKAVNADGVATQLGVVDLSALPLVTGIKASLKTQRDDETAAAQKAYKDFYEALTGKTLEGKNPVSGDTCSDLNTSLKGEIDKRLAEQKFESDSMEVKAYIQKLQTEVDKHIDAADLEDNRAVADFTKNIAMDDVTETPVEAAKKVPAKRAEEVKLAKDAYLAAYKDLVDSTATADTEAVKKALDTITGATCGDANGQLKDALDALVNSLAVAEKDSTNVKTYIGQVKAAVDAVFAAVTVEERKVPTFDSMTVGETKGQKFSDIKTALNEKRKSEVAAAFEEYKAEYKAITGNVYAETDTVAKGHVDAINATVYSADANAALKNGVKELLANYAKTLPEGVTAQSEELLDVVEKQQTAVNGVEAGDNGISVLSSVVMTAKNAINLQLYKDLKKASVEATYGAVDQSSISEAKQKELETKKTETLEGIQAVELSVLETNKGEIDKLVKAFEDAVELLKKVGPAQKEYLDAYLATHGTAADVADETVKGVLDDLNTKSTIADLNTALKTAVTALLRGMKSASDSAATTKLIDDALKVVTDLTAADDALLDFSAIDTIYTEVTAQRGADVTAAQEAYKTVYTALTGKVWTAEDVNPVTGVNCLEANTSLKEAIGNLVGKLTGETTSEDSAAIIKLLGNVKTALDTMIDSLNATHMAPNLTTDKLTITDSKSTTIAEVETELNRMRSKDVSAAKQAFVDAYNALMGTDYKTDTAALAEAMNAFITVVNCKNAIKTLKDLVDELLVGKAGATAEAPVDYTNSVLNAGDATDAKTYLADVKTAVDAVLDASNVYTSRAVPDLKGTFSVGEEEPTSVTLKQVAEHLVALRTASRTAAINQYLGVYNLLKGLKGDDAITYTDGKLPDGAPEEVTNFVASLEGKTTAEVNTLLKTAVKALLNGYVDEQSDSEKVYGTVVLYTQDSGTIDNAPVKDNGISNLVESITTAKGLVDNERADERTAAADEYKAVYEILKGSDYDEEKATADEKKVLTDIAAAKNATEANTALKAGVTALVNGLLITDAETKAVKDSNEVQGAVTDANEAANRVVAGDNGISVGISELELITGLVKKIGDFRTAEVAAAVTKYKTQYKAITGVDYAETDTAAAASVTAINATTNATDANAALKTAVKALLVKLQKEGDATEIVEYLKAKGTAEQEIDGAAADKDTGISDLIEVVGEIMAQVTKYRADELTAAATAYKTAYKTLKGSDYDETTATEDEKKVLTDIAASSTATAANGVLKDGVQKLLEGYQLKGDSKTVTDLFATHAKKIEEAEAENNGITDVAKLIEAAKTEIDNARNDSRKVAVNQYLEAYKLLKDSTATTETEAVSAFATKIADMTATAANAELVKAIQALFEGYKRSGDSNKVLGLVADAQTAVGKAAEATADNGISALKDRVSTQKGIIDAERTAEVEAAKNGYVNAYNALMNAQVTAGSEEVKAAVDEIGKAVDCKDANAKLAAAVNSLIDNLCEGESTEVKGYLAGLKTAVTAEQRKADTAKGRLDLTETLKGVTEKLAELREAGRNAAKNAYKTYYKTVKGTDCPDDDEVLTSLNGVNAVSEFNEILKNAINALLDGYLTEDEAENVKTVEGTQKTNIGTKIDAETEKGAVATGLASDLTTAMNEIDLQRAKNAAKAEIEELYTAVDTAKMEAGTVEDLEGLKDAAELKIDEATLADGTVAQLEGKFDDVIAQVKSAFEHKEAEGIAKNEYLKAYKAITGSDGNAEAEPTKSAFAAIEEAAESETDYIRTINTALKTAVEPLLESLLLKVDNVLKDSPETKALIEETKAAVKTLTTTATNNGEIANLDSEVQGIKEDVAKQRTAEKTAAKSKIDELATATDLSADVQTQLTALVTAAKAKVDAETTYYTDYALIEEKIGAQTEILVELSKLQKKATVDKLDIAAIVTNLNAAVQSVENATTSYALNKAADDAVLTAEKDYAKALLKEAAGDSEGANAKLAGPSGFNAKIDAAKNADEIQDIVDEGKVVVGGEHFLDAHSVLRKPFDSLTGSDKAALEAAKNALSTLDDETKASIKGEYSSLERDRR